MGYTHDRGEDDAMDLAMALLVKHSADRGISALDPELSELLLRKQIPGKLKIPADLLPFEDFDEEKMGRLGITFKMVAIRTGDVRCAIIKDPVLAAMVEVHII